MSGLRHNPVLFQRTKDNKQPTLRFPKAELKKTKTKIGQKYINKKASEMEIKQK